MIIVATMMHINRAMRPIMTAKRTGIISPLLDGVLIISGCPVDINILLEYDNVLGGELISLSSLSVGFFVAVSVSLFEDELVLSVLFVRSVH